MQLPVFQPQADNKLGVIEGAESGQRPGTGEPAGR